MSIEIASLSKEDKRARKEEKRRRKEEKAAKAAAAGEGAGEMMDVDVVVPVASSSGLGSGSAVAVAEGSGEKDKKKKEKKDKKRKRDGEDDAVAEVTAATAPASAPTDADKEAKKSKKDKKDKKAKKEKKDGNLNGTDTISSTPAETVLTTPAEPVILGASEDLSKKQLKKIAKAAASLLATSDGSSPAPSTVAAAAAAAGTASISTVFNAEHNDYLASNSITLTPSVYPPILSIPSLPVHSKITSFLSKFDKPTPIQSCAWPALLSGRDVVGVAETGSGKTLSFGVPGIHLLSTIPSGENTKKSHKGRGKGKGQIKLLVLAPTRELALQSHETLEALGQELSVGSVCIYGGVGKDEQIRAIADPKTKVVVGTPGRVLDLADSGELDLSQVSYLVLDEADRMLDQGFENDIRRIFAHCPGNDARQTVMFSATWPESVRRLASTFLNDPIRITVGSDELSANKRIEQIVEVLDHPGQKDSRMLHHLRTHLKSHPSTPASPTRILVFALYKKEASRLEYTIRRNKYRVEGLHGDMGQAERFKALDRFKRGEVEVLVATDVAARGLDIPDVGLVINVTFPLTTEDFVHRCGRTGRAGKSGRAVTFFTGEAHEKSLAGEFMRVLRDAGADIPKEMDRFPTTIKKKEHGSYGAFYKDISDAPAATKITFD